MGPDDDCVAELSIGDAALEKICSGEKSPFVYDLSFEWKRMTGLPFVFARWVARGDATETRTRKVRRDASQFLQLRHVPPARGRRTRIDTRHDAFRCEDLHRRFYVSTWR